MSSFSIFQPVFNYSFISLAMADFNNIRVGVHYFAVVGKRGKGSFIDDTLLDISESVGVGDGSWIKFVIKKSSLFSKHPCVDHDKVQAYFPWKGTFMRISDISTIRDGEDIYICVEDHVKAMRAHYLASNVGSNAGSQKEEDNTKDDSSTEPSTPSALLKLSASSTNIIKRKRSNLGKSVSERIAYHEAHQNDGEYNCPKRRFIPLNVFRIKYLDILDIVLSTKSNCFFITK